MKSVAGGQESLLTFPSSLDISVLFLDCTKLIDEKACTHSGFCVVLIWQVCTSNTPSVWIECNWSATQLCVGLFGSWHKTVACQEETEVNPAYFSKERELFCHSCYLSICSFIAFCTRSCLPFSEPNIAANAGGQTEG